MSEDASSSNQEITTSSFSGELPMLTPDQKSERDKSAQATYRNFVQIIDKSPNTEVVVISNIDSDLMGHGTKDTVDFHDKTNDSESTCYITGADQKLYKITAIESARTYPKIRVEYAVPSKQSEYLRFTSQGNDVVATRTAKPGEPIPLQTNELDGILINFLEHNFVSKEDAERMISESKECAEPQQIKSRRKALLSKLAIRKS